MTDMMALSCDSRKPRTDVRGVGVHMFWLRTMDYGLWTNRRGQSTVEYAVVLAAITAALLAMPVYLKRAMSGRIRDSADAIGEQYAPRQATSNMHITHFVVTHTESRMSNVNGFQVMDTNTNISSPGDRTARTGDEQVGALPNTIWD